MAGVAGGEVGVAHCRMPGEPPGESQPPRAARMLMGRGGRDVIEIPLEDLVYVVCLLVGGGLLLITVLVDDIIGGILDHFDIAIGGASLIPLLLSFVAMFGAGGLFATQVLDLHGAQAAIVGVLAGTGGALLAWGLFSFMRRSEAAEPFSTADLVGHDAFVAVSIPAGHWGSV